MIKLQHFYFDILKPTFISFYEVGFYIGLFNLITLFITINITIEQ
jgi:hypothetical protein